MSAALSRRQAMTGIALAGATALAPIAPASAKTAPSGDFAAEVRAYRKALSAEEVFCEHVSGPADEAYTKAINSIPHAGISNPLTGEPLRTSRKLDLAIAVSVVRNPGNFTPEKMRPYVDLATAQQHREEEVRRLRKRHQLDQIEEQRRKLARATDAALLALTKHPVNSAAELAEKLEVLDKAGAHEEPDAWTAILADARRLAKRQG